MTQDERSCTPAQQQEKNLRTELREQTQLADIGELAGQVNHKFNNFLNSLLLKIALLEAELPALATKFTDIKQQAHHMAEVIRQVHQTRRRQSSTDRLTDLNAALPRMVEQLKSEMPESAKNLAVTFEPVSAPAQVVMSPIDLQRLCSFLVRNRLAIPGQVKGKVILRTSVHESKVRLSLEDTRPSATGANYADFFDVDAVGAEGPGKLELGACKALVRRYQGRIQAMAASGGGLVIEIDFPAAAEGASG